jgi:uncharacterized coiled-coil protein SlyX
VSDKPSDSAFDELRREVAEKSRQLSELDVMLADYHVERARLIRDLRRLQVRLRDAEEQLQANSHHTPEP